MAGLHLQNPSNLNPTGATKKFGQILQKQAKSGEILTKSGQIWWDLAKFNQIPAISSQKNVDFKKKKKNLVSGENSKF